jgi:hypothetical protein
MHHSEIDHNVRIGNADADLGDSLYGDRPILLEGLAPVDGCDILVPASSREPESSIVALTREQGMQALLILAFQLGPETSVEAIRSRM